MSCQNYLCALIIILQFWFSWRHQLKVFSDDYHVVAVDLRGYGETERPPNTTDYKLTNLRQDVVELIPALGHDKATLVSHDWGGAIAWAVTQKYPELVEKLIVLNCPHTRVFKRTIMGTWAQLMKSWYMFLFQLPLLPEFILSMRDYGYFNAIFRGRKAGVRNRDAFPLEAVDAYKYVFSQPGATTGPINYYRCILSNNGERQLARQNIDTPTLIIWGDSDLFLETCMADAHADFVTNLTVKHIPNCSHWVQQDQPDKVNEYIREFL
jgi:pimeloyl-ACP methyl ester carboxylesterase